MLLLPAVISLFEHFGDAPAACVHGFFGFPTWYQYLPANDFDTNSACQLSSFHYPEDLAPVALAAVDIALTIAGMTAVFFVIYGGIQYVISQGEPDKTAGAKSTITNALVGLVLAGVAIAVVGFIGAQLGG